MNPTTLLRRLAGLAAGMFLVLVVIVAASCSKDKLSLPEVSNLSPTVRLTQAPIDTTSENFYSITLNWVGYDQDGRVDHYLYAIDPPEDPLADTVWVRSTENEKRLTFSAGTQAPDTTLDPGGGSDGLSDSKSRDFHTFVIAAVDDRGAIGPRVYRAFFTYTTAPTVNILSPVPSGLTNPLVPPSVRITWSGQDVDGVFTTRPIYYKYMLVSAGRAEQETGHTYDELVSKPSLFREVFAPDFPDSEGWVRTAAETTTAQFTNLNPGERYLFVVVAFDEAGAYSPVFTLFNSVLRFRVGFAATRGPRICMFNEFFFYCYPSGGYTVAPQAQRNIEVPEGQPIRFFWFAEPPEGANIRCYRWMMDGDVFDETPRTDEQLDTSHWSTCSASLNTATVGPFFIQGDSSATDHYFYIEAQDNIGLKSLGIVHFNVVRATLENPMLIVDDTRLNPDRISNRGVWNRPLGRWPTAAELDTFLFARGGNDWNYAYVTHPRAVELQAEGPYPPGTLTTPGLFEGYTYDTLGTRFGRADLTVPLSVIGKYKHVIWLVDGSGATNTRSGTDGTQPSTSLRYMSAAGRVNTLGALVKQGGLVWLAGGGGAMANLHPNNDPANDVPPLNPTITFSKLTGRAQFRELDQGRMMHDLAKWQSEIRIANAPSKPIKNLGRFRSIPGLYAMLPDSMQPKTPATDPLPPLRNSTDFYISNFDFEFLEEENVYTEPILTDPVDFLIDTFNDVDPNGIAARWKSTDSLNTTVSQDPSGQAGTKAMQIATQGSGASNGDRVSRTFSPARDWSGLNLVRFGLKQSTLTGLQWRVRIVDDQGASMAALVPIPNSAGVFATTDIRLNQFVTDSPTQPNLVHVSRIEFEPVTATAAATTSIDQLFVAMTFDAPVLDTLYSARGGGSTSLPELNATMTYYHGHDSTPFVFTGFSLWMYRRAECQVLIDFVLQRLWGMSKSGGAPGLRARQQVPLHATPVVSRPGPSRITPPMRGAGKVPAARRSAASSGTRK